MMEFNLNEFDMAMVDSARLLLRAVLGAPSIPAARVVSVAKLAHVFERLPRATEGVTVSVQVVSPRRHHGEIETFHYWEISTEDDGLISIESGGHYYHPATGGDTFTTYQWTVAPGSESELEEHFSSLFMVPDLQSFSEAVGAIDFEQGYFLTELHDCDNSLLDELNDEDES
jgi:hypothetical protein